MQQQELIAQKKKKMRMKLIQMMSKKFLMKIKKAKKIRKQ